MKSNNYNRICINFKYISFTINEITLWTVSTVFSDIAGTVTSILPQYLNFIEVAGQKWFLPTK